MPTLYCGVLKNPKTLEVLGCKEIKVLANTPLSEPLSARFKFQVMDKKTPNYLRFDVPAEIYETLKSQYTCIEAGGEHRIDFILKHCADITGLRGESLLLYTSAFIRKLTGESIDLTRGICFSDGSLLFYRGYTDNSALHFLHLTHKDTEVDHVE